MVVNKQKLELAMARACMNREEIAQKAKMPTMTVKNVIDGRNVRPATLGKVAKALGVDPVEIIETEE